PVPIPAKAVTREDYRWGRCDIKAITLLANVLYRQEAADAGCQETILTRDGFVTEGAVSNVFVVRDDFIVTPPKGRNILPGITRDLVVELAMNSDLPCVEAAISEGELREADEIWITASTIEIIPVVELDGRVVGDGRPGQVWNKMHALFEAYRNTTIDE
ncbi:MAG: D-amino acid aminotransferase, partial [Gammaproteobacteria bacterium]